MEVRKVRRPLKIENLEVIRTGKGLVLRVFEKNRFFEAKLLGGEMLGPLYLEVLEAFIDVLSNEIEWLKLREKLLLDTLEREKGFASESRIKELEREIASVRFKKELCERDLDTLIKHYLNIMNPTPILKTSGKSSIEVSSEKTEKKEERKDVLGYFR
jgi:hypothetical protein